MRAVLACPLRRVPGLAVGDSVQHAGRRPPLLLRKCTCMTGGWLLLPLLLLLLGLPGRACWAECAGRQAQAGVTTPQPTLASPSPLQAVLITNPNNPLGTIYSEETIKEMIAWCLDNRVHYIRCGPCGVLNRNSHFPDKFQAVVRDTVSRESVGGGRAIARVAAAALAGRWKVPQQAGCCDRWTRL